jgi:hypothetical protein
MNNSNFKVATYVLLCGICMQTLTNSFGGAHLTSLQWKSDIHHFCAGTWERQDVRENPPHHSGVNSPELGPTNEQRHDTPTDQWQREMYVVASRTVNVQGGTSCQLLCCGVTGWIQARIVCLHPRVTPADRTGEWNWIWAWFMTWGRPVRTTAGARQQWHL